MRLFVFAVSLLVASAASAAVNDATCTAAATDQACEVLDYNDLTAQQQTDLAAYHNVFVNSEIAAAIPYRVLPQAYRAAIWSAFDTARVNSGVPSQPLLASMEPNQDWGRHASATHFRAWLTEQETVDVIANKIAHAFYLEINRVAEGIPWSIVTYTLEQLRGLFAVENDWKVFATEGPLLADWKPSGAAAPTGDWSLPDPYYGTLFVHVDHSPSDVETQTRLLTGTLTTQEQAVRDILEFFQTGVKHNTSSAARPIVAFPPDQWFTKFLDVEAGETERWSRYGCQTTCSWLGALLRAINIPAYKVQGFWGAPASHASCVFPTVSKVMAHGDDVYFSAGVNKPDAFKMLTPLSVWEEFIFPRKRAAEGGTAANDTANAKATARVLGIQVYSAEATKILVSSFCSQGWNAAYRAIYRNALDACETNTVSHELCESVRAEQGCEEVACPAD